MAFKPKNKDSLANVLTVSVLLCLVCSAVVSVAAVSLRDLQNENEKLAKQRNRLIAAGLIEVDASNEAVDEVYAARIREQWIDLSDGEPTLAPEPGTKAFDFEAAADDEDFSAPIPSGYGVPGRRPNVAPVYQVLSEDGSTVEKVVLPVSGKGLWSTLRAYLALDVNFDEDVPRDRFPIAGVTFYEQAETAGLGAEVENPIWQEDWQGQFAFDEEWSPQFEVAKVPAAEGTDAAAYQVDALAGATITGNGVEAMVNYWLSEDAFGAYLRKVTPEFLELNRVDPATAEQQLEEEAERTAS
ncbi:NADH:ubiquinone reductase (Na(+)-transporting) subunit C [Alienimonas californiensis]|uniref:Na(+)-translocating NADH-quinone reductase subunit C n=1 Tax=Alienimonas californiensis TaxID=2527989 RepID=A0A517PBE9_9PLAN|nr:NADH:ubiquinone reductase (Na(+)-transporting) subunit C [Alienimonas californiensis]QDT16708.1 Na(+)-translocating NADH-quinone reductase subunit C [Alienimonas californiensis]